MRLLSVNSRPPAKPFIFTYFKNATVDTGNTDEEALLSLLAFKNKLKDLGHFLTPYPNIEGLQLHFGRQLDMLAANGFIEFQPEREASGGNTCQATLTGSGAINQGSGTAIGAGGVYVGGASSGTINTGTIIGR